MIDVSSQPQHAFGHRSLTWWGNTGYIALESAGFVLAISAYVMLMHRADDWPPGLPPPGLFWSTLLAVLLLASLLPNVWVKRRAEREDGRGVRVGMAIMLGVGVVLLVVRAFEFGALNCRWDSNAYGSIVWALLTLHTVHLLTDVVDTAVLTVLMFTKHAEGRRFTDVSENSV
jgi:heme/copper-type cytochrome/quinol oxidase subunit 3